ncbi:cytochrome P450 [Agrocybe pediades]|nr:cytochrome P450 [Agrocybe pediades]
MQSPISTRMASTSLTYSPQALYWNLEYRSGVAAPYLLAFGVACFLAISAITFIPRPARNGKVYDLGGVSLFHAWQFFTRRYDFIQEKFKESGRSAFRFNVVQHRVVSFSGEKARQAFFNEPGLSLVQGYKILTGGWPELKDIDFQSDKDGQYIQDKVEEGFVKRILALIRKDRILATLPHLFVDLNRLMDDWGTAGTMNPFDEIYELVFQMTIRMSTCKEIADDKKVVQEIAKQYWAVEHSASPFFLLFPSFPSPMKKAKAKATTALYKILLSFVQQRRNSPTRTTDPIDLFIAQGDTDDNIVGTIIGVVFSGVINTGTTTCWNLLCLGSSPVWKEKVIEDFKKLLHNNTPAMADEPIYKRLASIPYTAWEDELPAVDLVIKETLRIIGSSSAMRRNIHHDITVDGVSIKRGDFMTYQAADAHFNPDVYTDPKKFDPGRYLEGREEDKKEAYAYIGWGAGRHFCAGMKLAKLEIKLVLALFLLQFDFELVDANGNPRNSFPEPDPNQILQTRPIGEPCFFKFKRISG